MDRTTLTVSGRSLRVVRGIVQNEGALAGLYRGLAPNIVGNSVSWALYFLWYGKIKDEIYNLHGPSTQLSSFEYFVASGTAGASDPVWQNEPRS